jgi:hypothetical protein
MGSLRETGCACTACVPAECCGQQAGVHAAYACRHALLRVQPSCHWATAPPRSDLTDRQMEEEERPQGAPGPRGLSASWRQAAGRQNCGGWEAGGAKQQQRLGGHCIKSPLTMSHLLGPPPVRRRHPGDHRRRRRTAFRHGGHVHGRGTRRSHGACHAFTGINTTHAVQDMCIRQWRTFFPIPHIPYGLPTCQRPAHLPCLVPMPRPSTGRQDGQQDGACPAAQVCA